MLEITLTRDGKTILKVPIGDEMAKSDVKNLAEDFFDILSERRAKALLTLLEEGEMSFKDLMAEIESETINSKLVYNCIKPLQERNLVVHTPRKEYKLSEEGTQFAELFAGFTKMVELLFEDDPDDEAYVHKPGGAHR